MEVTVLEPKENRELWSDREKAILLRVKQWLSASKKGIAVI